MTVDGVYHCLLFMLVSVYDPRPGDVTLLYSTQVLVCPFVLLGFVLRFAGACADNCHSIS